MAREKKPVHKVEMTDGKRNIIQQLLQEYEIQSAEDVQKMLKDLLGAPSKISPNLIMESKGIRVLPSS